MKKTTVALVLVSILSLLLFSSGCSSNTKVSDILANPTQYETRDVNIKGYVGNTFWISLTNKGAYEIGDGSGTVWVVTTQPPPQKGAEIAITGTVKPAFTLGEKSLGTVLVETKRK